MLSHIKECLSEGKCHVLYNHLYQNVIFFFLFGRFVVDVDGDQFATFVQRSTFIRALFEVTKGVRPWNLGRDDSDSDSD